jgi:hypothetical protein
MVEVLWLGWQELNGEKVKVERRDCREGQRAEESEKEDCRGGNNVII